MNLFCEVLDFLLFQPRARSQCTVLCAAYFILIGHITHSFSTIESSINPMVSLYLMHIIQSIEY